MITDYTTIYSGEQLGRLVEATCPLYATDIRTGDTIIVIANGVGYDPDSHQTFDIDKDAVLSCLHETIEI